MTPEELIAAKRLFTTASRSEDGRVFAQLGSQIMDAGRALLAEVEALRKDAERYRWLRQWADPEKNQHFPIELDPISPDHMDELIDAFLADRETTT